MAMGKERVGKLRQASSEAGETRGKTSVNAMGITGKQLGTLKFKVREKKNNREEEKQKKAVRKRERERRRSSLSFSLSSLLPSGREKF